MAEDRSNEALEKLNQGILESRQMVQQQTMQLAQDFFSDSVEEMKNRVGENRSNLEGLPDQIPGGQDEAFQMLFQELMDNYAAIEQALEEARKNVTDLDTDRLAQESEVNASDAARREARDLDVDLTEVEGSGSGGRIIVSDVVEASQQAAKQKAEELGVDISEVEGSGSGGLVTVKDVMGLAEGTGDAATETVDEATDEVEETMEQAVQEVGEVADSENGTEAPNATNAAQRRAEELGVDLSALQGSGAGGLITVKDVVKV